MPSRVRSRWPLRRSSPEVRPLPVRLWQWAQLTSSQVRARSSTLPEDARFQIGARGVYGHPELPDFMVFLDWSELP